MKTKIIYFLALILFGFTSYPQNDDTLLVTKVKSARGSATWTIYTSKNWGNKFIPMPSPSYTVENFSIDTEEIKKIAREEISNKYYDQLNKSLWAIVTKLTGDGQIISVRFSFRDRSGIDIKESVANIEEFTRFAGRIKREVKWKLTFNKEVTDSFNLQYSIFGPKL